MGVTSIRQLRQKLLKDFDRQTMLQDNFLGYFQIQSCFLTVNKQLYISNYNFVSVGNIKMQSRLCGLPSKPRNAEPSMFQILSWNTDEQIDTQLSQLKAQNDQYLKQTPFVLSSNGNPDIQTQTVQNSVVCFKVLPGQIYQKNQHMTIVQEIYKQNQSPQKDRPIMFKAQVKAVGFTSTNNDDLLKKLHLYPKKVKNELNSYQTVNLKASRSKSAIIPQKNQLKEAKKLLKQEVILDQKTIFQRKQRIKQFQLFTRVLPNTAFTTYYGKPAFQSYGRGSSGKNLKSHNIMPHKGDNHPKDLQSHYSALIKGRKLQSKSSLPRKPVDQVIQPHVQQRQDRQAINVNFPLEKPNLVNNLRFSTVVPQNDKKAGPPYISKNASGVKKSKTRKATQGKQNKTKEGKNKTQVLPNGFKLISQRQNLIDLLQQKKLKDSQLAYKVTQCYPSQWNRSNLCESTVSRYTIAAGKQSKRCDQVAQLIHGSQTQPEARSLSK